MVARPGLASNRVLFKAYQARKLENEFSTLTIDAHLLRALTNWCMSRFHYLIQHLRSHTITMVGLGRLFLPRRSMNPSWNHSRRLCVNLMVPVVERLLTDRVAEN